MGLDIENTTRFFAVVGAPYVAEHHADSDIDCPVPPRHAQRAYAAPSSTNWLSSDR